MLRGGLAELLQTRGHIPAGVALGFLVAVADAVTAFAAVVAQATSSAVGVRFLPGGIGLRGWAGVLGVRGRAGLLAASVELYRVADWGGGRGRCMYAVVLGADAGVLAHLRYMFGILEVIV